MIRSGLRRLLAAARESSISLESELLSSESSPVLEDPFTACAGKHLVYRVYRGAGSLHRETLVRDGKICGLGFTVGFTDSCIV